MWHSSLLKLFSERLHICRVFAWLLCALAYSVNATGNSDLYPLAGTQVKTPHNDEVVGIRIGIHTGDCVSPTSLSPGTFRHPATLLSSSAVVDTCS